MFLSILFPVCLDPDYQQDWSWENFQKSQNFLLFLYNGQTASEDLWTNDVKFVCGVQMSGLFTFTCLPES